MTYHEDEEVAASSGAPLVQSLSRGLGILAQFTADSRTLSLTELCRRTGLHKATVYRFVKTLEAEGYLVAVSGGAYRVGLAWAMALYALGSDEVFSEILESDLRALAQESMETVALGVRQGTNVHVVHVLPPSRSFIPVLPPSHLTPLDVPWNVHSQILAAFLGHTNLEKYAQVRSEGVAYDREGFHVGTCAVGVPIYSRGKVVAALGLIVPVERFTDEGVATFVKQLRSAATTMGRRLDASLKA
jgi:DNA-binding IclR family transcriptional regulator